MKSTTSKMGRKRPPQATGAPVRQAQANAARARQRESAEDHRLLQAHRLIGTYHTTLDGRILDCNASMARMLGYRSRRELIAHRASDLYPRPTDRKAFLAQLRRAGVLMNSELCLRRKDGSLMYVLENVALVRAAGARPASIQGAMVDITERKRAEEALRRSETRYRVAANELRQLTRHVEKVREAGRTRIARELHDELGQALTVLNMDLHWLHEQVVRRHPILKTRVAAMGKLVGQTIQALRRICADLRPALLDDLGLCAAIEWQAREFEQRTGIRCSISIPATNVALSRDQATAVFRILQESLTNVARHARATHVDIAMRVRSRTLTLRMTDDGVGIVRAASSAGHSLGLMGMRERAKQWGGCLEVVGTRGKGTTVTLRMSIADETAEVAT